MWNSITQKPEHEGEIILRGVLNYQYPFSVNSVFIGSYDKGEDVFLDRFKDPISKDTLISGWQHLPGYE
jgi:hypothetical protein